MEVKKKKRISVQSAKAKGRRLQQWAGQMIADLTGFEFGHDCPIESRGMGQSGTDVRMDAQVLKQFPFSVECKSQESWSVHSWIDQAKNNELPDTDWLLICKRSRHSPVAVLDAETFFKILSNGRKTD
jgi:hypothetical protein